MRAILAAALALSLAAPAVAAEAVPPGAEAAVSAIKGLARGQKSVTVRKIKVNAAGDVCALVSPSAGASELQFTWTKLGGEVWLNEAPDNAYSEFVWGDTRLRRSTDRKDYQAWKTCQKG